MKEAWNVPQLRLPIMDMNESIEMALMEPEEREMVEYIMKMINDENGDASLNGGNGEKLTADDVLFVLDMMDDYLEEKGLLREDPKTGEMEYLEGDVDETEQLDYILKAVREEGRSITSVQVQLIQDAELQYGIEKGYYVELLFRKNRNRRLFNKVIKNSRAHKNETKKIKNNLKEKNIKNTVARIINDFPSAWLLAYAALA